MKFADSIVQAYQTNWSYSNTFSVQIQFAPKIAKYIGWETSTERDINLNLVSIDTPQFSNQPIEVYVGDRWKLHVGRNEAYAFSMTFRDQDQMSYYKTFLKAYYYQQKEYFDNVKMTITLWKDADYLDEADDSILFNFEDTIISSVSQLQFNNTTEAQIAEFTVQFKCATPDFEPKARSFK